ncbi:hypothetical protein ABIA30_000857 [Mycobacterium sp. MAA66]|uniref:HNH endonuclease signature motif containing protein n=1 Tax=Mycobacterium sp. MAA66 TaxID=3156297 RepID=UPI0035140FC6
MFDLSPGLFVGVDDSALIDRIAGYARVEAEAAAGRLAAIAELVARRCDDEDGRALWACDGWDVAAAEIGAVLTIGRREASGQMSIGIALRTRLPRVAAVLAAGGVSVPVVAMITWRTRLVTDPDVLAVLDAAVAGAMTQWGVLSKEALARVIDGWVHKFDPVAVIRTRSAARNRSIEFGKPDDETGTVSIWGALLATDGALFERAITEIALTVCAADPRTLGQRRADAVGVLAVRGSRLACRCAQPHCPAAATPDAPAAAVIIHVLTDTVPAPKLDRQLHTPIAASALVVAEPAADPAPAPARPAPPANPARTIAGPRPPVGYLQDGQVIPPTMLADLLARGAKLRHLARADDLGSIDRYRPSAAMADFVRMRHLSCSFPGCTAPAVHCDIDHTIAWPAGPTHPGNLSPKCRKHHLLKTFYGGPGGWRDRQEPDGTVVWTTPTGHTYRSMPGSRILFPDTNFDTPLPPPTAPDSTTGPGRGIMMPQRRRTRAHDRAARIANERTLNEQELATTHHDKPSASETKPDGRGSRDHIISAAHPPDHHDPPPF